VESRTYLLSTKNTKRHEENHVFFIHEGHEGHEEKILRKIGMGQALIPERGGAAVMGQTASLLARRPHHSSTIAPSGAKAWA
jgi:hypothetical protein